MNRIPDTAEHRMAVAGGFFLVASSPLFPGLLGNRKMLEDGEWLRASTYLEQA